ncbi:SDR family oxidoreductase [Dongia sp.]|uniref:SDR family oxidoreductase n=1 Tax=Dongia sp. TaxID=1977262 RepID=UPI0035B0441B
MDLGIAGKRALVLGASQGLGAASAAALAAEGVSVTLLARNAAKLQERVAEIAGAGGVATSLVADLTRAGDLASILGDQLGYDILVLNSPPPPPIKAGTVDRSVWSQQFEAMFLNQIELAAHLVKGMAARRWGRIVSIASTSVQEPIPGLVYSNALRAGLQGYLKSLSDEVAAQGVTVNTVAPGSFATERTHSLDAAAAKRSGKALSEIQAEGASGIPLGRYGEPAEFGAMVAFLCARQSSYTTGGFFRVDGGSSRCGI